MEAPLGGSFHDLSTVEKLYIPCLLTTCWHGGAAGGSRPAAAHVATSRVASDISFQDAAMVPRRRRPGIRSRPGHRGRGSGPPGAACPGGLPGRDAAMVPRSGQPEIPSRPDTAGEAQGRPAQPAPVDCLEGMRPWFRAAASRKFLPARTPPARLRAARRSLPRWIAWKGCGHGSAQRPAGNSFPPRTPPATLTAARRGPGPVDCLKENVEIHGEAAAAMPEEVPIRHVGDIGMQRLGVEVVGQVEARERQTDGVLGVHLDVFRDAGID